MSRKYMNDRWCVRCGRTSPTPFLVRVHKKLRLDRMKLNVLDIGCGNGRNSQWLRAQGHTVLGLDMAGDGGKKFVLGTNKFPCKDSWADVVLLNYVLMFLDERERLQVATEIKRCSHPDDYPGTVLIEEMYPAKDSHCPDAASCVRMLDEFNEWLDLSTQLETPDRLHRSLWLEPL